MNRGICSGENTGGKVLTKDNESPNDLIRRVQLGEQGAYAKVIQNFQDMAIGYSYSILRDRQLAEDAAQEAFIRAYYDLPDLRNSAAFPGWFRRIVFTQINRIQRARKVHEVPLELASETASTALIPLELIERREMQEEVLTAISALPEHQRIVVTLFYINEYSQREISAFLEIPVATVKTRLYAARKRLKGEMIHLIKDYLIENRPSNSEAFIKEMGMKLALAKVVSCGMAGCQVRLIEDDTLLDTRYSLQIQDQIKIRPEQLVVIDRIPTPAQIVFRPFLSQVVKVQGDQLTVELLRDEGDRGKGQYAQATLAEGLDLDLKVGDDVYGYSIVLGKAINGRPAHPVQLLTILTPIVSKIYESDRFQLDPDSAAAHTNRGNVHLDQGEYELALDAYNQALTVNPNYIVAYTNRGHAYQAKQDSASARADFEQVIALLGKPTPDILPDNHPSWQGDGTSEHMQKSVNTRLRRAKKHLAAVEAG